MTWQQVTRAHFGPMYKENRKRLIATHSPAVTIPAAPPEAALYVKQADGWTVVLNESGRPVLAPGTACRVVGLGHDLGAPAVSDEDLGTYLETTDIANTHCALGTLRDLRADKIFLGHRHMAAIPHWRQVVYVMEQDPAVLQLFLCTPMGATLSDPGVFLWTGPGCEDGFIDHLRGERRAVLPGTAALFTAELHDRAAAVQEARDVETTAAVDDVRRYYQGRPVLRERLKVAVTSTLFSTVVGPTSLDLAAGFRELGHEAIVITEGSPDNHMSSNYVATTLEDEKPDAAVVLSHIRPEFGIWPEGMPFIGWIQDSMAGVFNAENSAKLVADTDISMCVNEEYCKQLRKMGHPNVSRLLFAGSTEKYYPEPDGEYEHCIIYPCHMPDPDVLPYAPGLSEFIMQEVQGWVGTRTYMYQEIEGLCKKAIKTKRWNVEPDSFQYYELTRAATQACRNEDRKVVARWIKDAGIPIAIYGHGWDKLPEWADHWRGVALPGEQMRQVYCQAGAILQVGLNVHQRVFEASLCGTPIICQDHSDDHQPGGLAEAMEIGTEILQFSGHDQCVDLAHRILSRGKLRDDVAHAARKRVLRDHTYKHRAQSMVDAIRELRA